MSDQKLQRPLKKSDTRWTDKDKVKQLKGIAELHERTLKWMKVKKGAQVEKYKKEGRELDKKTEKIRRMLKDISQGDSAQIRDILKKDKEAWLICKDQSPDGIIECLDHLIFLQRRELDRLKFEVEINNKKLFDAKLQEELMSEASEKEKLGPAKFRVQELAAEIEHVKTQTKAANLVEKTYDRLRRILKKESLNIDEILDGLKVDMLVQAECILKAMEMGQTAVEDKANFIIELKKEMKFAKEEKEKHMAEIKQFKQMISRIKKINSSLARAESFVKINYQSNEEKQKFIKDLQEKVKKRKEQFRILMYVTTSNAPHEVFPRIESVMKERFRLLRQLEINKMVRDTEVTRKNYMDFTLDTIKDNDILQTREYEIKKKDLEDRISRYEKELEKYTKQMEIAGKYVLRLRKNIYMFNRLFTDVKIGNPGPTNLAATIRGDGEEDDDIFDDCDPKEFDDDDPERLFAPLSDSSSNDHAVDLNTAHILDIITLKLNIILNEMKEGLTKKEQKYIQVPDEDFILEDSSGSESEPEDLKTEEDYMVAGYYVGELGYDTDEDEDEGERCVRPKTTSTEEILKTKLLCDADPFVRPYHNFSVNSVAVVKLEFNLKYIYVGSLTSSALMVVKMQWDTDFMKWDPSKYNNIKSIVLPGSSVWKPTFFLLDSWSSNLEEHGITFTSDGIASVTFDHLFSSVCSSDLQFWPFDEYKCESNVLYLHQMTNFEIKSNAVNMSLFKPNRWFHLVDIHIKPETIYKQIDDIVISLKLKRSSNLYISVAVVPVLILVMLVLISFWIHPLDQSRLILLMVTFGLHIYYLKYIASLVPYIGKTINLISYLRNSLIICFLSIILLRVSKTTILSSGGPAWLHKIKKVSDDIGLTFSLLLPKDETVAYEEESVLTTEEPKIKQDWVQNAIFLDRICFLLFFNIYFINLIIYMFV